MLIERYRKNAIGVRKGIWVAGRGDWCRLGLSTLRYSKGRKRGNSFPRRGNRMLEMVVMNVEGDVMEYEAIKEIRVRLYAPCCKKQSE